MAPGGYCSFLACKDCKLAIQLSLSSRLTGQSIVLHSLLMIGVMAGTPVIIAVVVTAVAAQLSESVKISSIDGNRYLYYL
jgi:hypothetical protein